MLSKEFLLNAYFKECKSGRKIAEETGLTSGQVFGLFKKYGIRMRTKKESIRLRPKDSFPSGPDHWGYGKTKETHHMYAQHSNRMTINNPMANPKIRTKILDSLADTLRERPTKWEKAILDLVGDFAVFQMPFENRIVDFAFLDQRIVLEIDGKGHSASGRKGSDIIKDRILVDQGWIILRYRQSTDTAPRLTRLMRILEQFIPDLDVSRTLPAFTNDKYGVIVRSKEYPTGIRVVSADDPRIVPLVHSSVHTAKSSFVR